MSKYWIRGVVIAMLLGFLVYVITFKYQGVPRIFQLPVKPILVNETAYHVLSATGDTLGTETIQTNDAGIYHYYEIIRRSYPGNNLHSGMRLITDSLNRPLWAHLEFFKVIGTKRDGADSLRSDSQYLYFQPELARLAPVKHYRNLPETELETRDSLQVDFGFLSAWNALRPLGSVQLIMLDTAAYAFRSEAMTLERFETDSTGQRFMTLKVGSDSLVFSGRAFSPTWSEIRRTENGTRLSRKYSQKFTFQDLKDLAIPEEIKKRDRLKAGKVI
ncbi:MAG: hypothetical protein HUU10_04680 [Bacteroidetes bacterium]|nr:hypothetical protein [Bacteroidota bacterium]